MIAFAAYKANKLIRIILMGAKRDKLAQVNCNKANCYDASNLHVQKKFRQLKRRLCLSVH